jgi:hypothetical protein
MVASTQIHGIHIHTTIVGSVVRKSEDDLEVLLFGESCNLIKSLHTVVAIVCGVSL